MTEKKDPEVKFDLIAELRQMVADHEAGVPYEEPPPLPYPEPDDLTDEEVDEMWASNERCQKLLRDREPRAFLMKQMREHDEIMAQNAREDEAVLDQPVTEGNVLFNLRELMQLEEDRISREVGYYPGCNEPPRPSQEEIDAVKELFGILEPSRRDDPSEPN